MAGPDEGDIKQEIIPSLYQTRAAEWVTPLLLCNTSADDKWLPSGAWDASGRRILQCPNGLFICEFSKRDSLGDWYQHLRTKAIRSIDSSRAHSTKL